MRSSGVILHANNLHKTYGSGHLEVKALRGVGLKAHRGEMVALLGPSGSGKSTLLTALGLLNLPEMGSLELGGERVYSEGEALRDLATLRRTRMGFVFQRSNLIPFLTAKENVLIPFQLEGKVGRPAESRAADLLKAMGMEERSHHYPEMLSGGEQQRVAIARALALDPLLILADEPTSALDINRGKEVMHIFRQAAHTRGTAVVVVTHDHRILEFFDSVYEMEDGCMHQRSSTSSFSPSLEVAHAS